MNPRKVSISSSSDSFLTEGSGGRDLLSEPQWRSVGDSLRLSDRELQILRCIFDDFTEAAMALKLGISSHTVHTHLERLYRKLEVASRCAAVVRVFAEYLDQESPNATGPTLDDPPAGPPH